SNDIKRTQCAPIFSARGTHERNFGRITGHPQSAITSNSGLSKAKELQRGKAREIRQRRDRVFAELEPFERGTAERLGWHGSYRPSARAWARSVPRREGFVFLRSSVKDLDTA